MTLKEQWAQEAPEIDYTIWLERKLTMAQKDSARQNRMAIDVTVRRDNKMPESWRGGMGKP
jgi:hypothetical protein